MAISEPEWESIRSMIEHVIGREAGTRRDFFTTGEVVKVDGLRNCVFLEEFGDQPIPIVGQNFISRVYDTVIPTDTKHLVGTAGEPAFQNGAVNVGGGQPPAAFWKDAAGMVYLEGLITPNTAYPNAMWVMPVSYRPAAQMIIPAYHSGEAACRLNIQSGGEVTQVGVSPTTNWMTLAGISFNSGVPLATAVQVRKSNGEISLPAVGESVLVARELGTRRLPRCLGVIQGKDWIVAEED